MTLGTVHPDRLDVANDDHHDDLSHLQDPLTPEQTMCGLAVREVFEELEDEEEIECIVCDDLWKERYE